MSRVVGLASPGFPDYAHAIFSFIRRKFTARVTRFHSHAALSKTPQTELSESQHRLDPPEGRFPNVLSGPVTVPSTLGFHLPDHPAKRSVFRWKGSGGEVLFAAHRNIPIDLTLFQHF